MDYRARQLRLGQEIEAKRLDGLLVTHLPNVRYLCGFSGSAGVLLATSGGAVLFTDGRYTVQARKEVKGARVVIARKAPLAAAAEHLPTRSGRRAPAVGIEAEHLTVAARELLRKRAAAGFRLRSTSGLVEQLRRVKDDEELNVMRAAARLGSELFEQIVRQVRPGIREVEIAAELEYSARQAGAEGMSFPTIVAAGPRSALPHAHASAGRVPRRGFVVLDFGVILAGYCSDMTRTVHVGRPDLRSRALYAAVLESQEAGVNAVRARVSAGDVDHAAREVLVRRKLARYFTHSTGHGVGLEIHEGPRLAKGQSEKLQNGMVVTVEPGVYIPGRGGVRLEDMVLVTGNGPVLLTTASKELLTL
jgi:Xaa-Pro aminopeptidase